MSLHLIDILEPEKALPASLLQSKTELTHPGVEEAAGLATGQGGKENRTDLLAELSHSREIFF